MDDWKELWKKALGPQLIFIGCLFILAFLCFVVVKLCYISIGDVCSALIHPIGF